MRFKLAAFADEADSRISEQIKIMTGNGIDYLEIRGVDGEDISNITKEKALEVRKKLDEAGLTVWSLGSPYGKIGINDDFISHLDKFKYGLELAEILGAEHIRIFSFYVPSGNEEDYKDEVMHRLEQFIHAAEGHSVILCHENEKGIYGDIASRCQEIHRTFPELRAVFDPANFIQCGQNTVEAWDMLAPYVEYMHIKDAMPDGSVVPAGKGIGDIPYLLKNYKGNILTVEPHLFGFDGLDRLESDKKTTMGYCYPTSEAAFNAAVAALKELIGGLL